MFGKHTPSGARRAGRAASRRWARLPARAVLPALLLALLVAAGGCSPRFTSRRLEDQSCQSRRLNAAGITYEEAKEQFAEHFKVRSDTALRYAYLASADSVRLARSIRTCFDFTQGGKVRAIELVRANRVLRILIIRNLRDLDPQLAIGVFGDQYRDIFKNDIN